MSWFHSSQQKMAKMCNTLKNHKITTFIMGSRDSRSGRKSFHPVTRQLTRSQQDVYINCRGVAAIDQCEAWQKQ